MKPMKQYLSRACVVLLCWTGPCAAHAEILNYDDVRPGKLEGRLVVQWMEPDLFLFIPDAQSPLTFTRSDGRTITPGTMKTDGGSIPRPIWILRSYSPWGFAPAFIVHDWLFEMKACKKEGYDKLTLEDSGLVMAEIMKTMIVGKKIDAGQLAVVSMYEAVVSTPARKHWEQGVCAPVKPGLFNERPIQKFTLSF